MVEITMQHSPQFLAIVNSVLPHIKEITIAEYQQDPRWQLVDVREDCEWKIDHFPNAVHISKGVIERDIEAKFEDKQTPLALYCGGGYRSALAAYNLQLMGYINVVSLIGGYKAWKALQLPLIND